MRTAFAITALIFAAGCSSQGVDDFLTSPEVKSTNTATVGQRQQDLFHGTKPRVAVMAFDNKSGVYNFYNGKAVGDGMNEQLVTAFMETGMFVVVERAMLGDVMQEQDLNNSDRFRAGGATPIGQLEGADFLVYGAVTEMLESQAGAGLGVVSKHGNAINLLEGVGAALQQDHVAIDLRLVDARTGQVVSATTVEGRARDLGANLGISVSHVLIGASGSYRTPIQKAIRACMIRAVDWTALRIADAGIVRGPREVDVAASQAAAQAQDDRLMVPVAVDGAKVRMSAAPDSLVIATLSLGSQINVIAEQGEWVQVRLPNGREGWVAKSAFNQ
ncbi:MAG: CsgG/HfaB family protein [Planctomycetota bacterium]